MRKSIESLKREAKKIKKDVGCSHTEALDEVARANGFDNWSLLMRTQSIEEPLTAKSIKQSPTSAIKSTMMRDSTLTAFGFGVFDERRLSSVERKAQFESERTKMLSTDCVRQFQRACRWLQMVGRTKRINRRVGSSYGLKHRVENYWHDHFPTERRYIQNGMFIAAAIHLGFIVKRIQDSPNAYFNISSVGLPPGDPY